MCCVAHCHGVSASNGQPPGEHLVGHHAERVDVAARIELLAGELLGAHVRRGSEHHALLRELLLLRLILGLAALGDAEVEDLHEVGLPGRGREDDVVGLEIAMDDAAAVRFFERAAHLRRGCAVTRSGAHGPALQRVGEALPLDELHRDVELAVGGLPEVEELNRVGVLELADGAALAVKAREDCWSLSELRLQRLDRDLADVGAHLLLGEVDAAHAAFAEDLRDAVAPADDLPDQRVLRPSAEGRVGARRTWRKSGRRRRSVGGRRDNPWPVERRTKRNLRHPNGDGGRKDALAGVSPGVGAGDEGPRERPSLRFGAIDQDRTGRSFGVGNHHGGVGGEAAFERGGSVERAPRGGFVCREEREIEPHPIDELFAHIELDRRSAP